MIFHTKYDIGDRVWGVSRTDFHRIVRCKICKNTGKINIGEELICPKCNGKSTHKEYVGQKYFVSCIGSFVGQVRVEETGGRHLSFQREGEPNPKFEYMLEDTGVVSGQIWREEFLFKSEKDAQDYCDRVNGLLPKDETVEGNAILDPYGKIVLDKL